MHPLAVYVAYHQGELRAEAEAQRLARTERPTGEGRMTAILRLALNAGTMGVHRARTLARA